MNKCEMRDISNTVQKGSQFLEAPYSVRCYKKKKETKQNKILLSKITIYLGKINNRMFDLSLFNLNKTKYTRVLKIG